MSYTTFVLTHMRNCCKTSQTAAAFTYHLSYSILIICLATPFVLLNTYHWSCNTICPSQYLSFVLHTICPSQYLSFVLHTICPSQYLSFVLHTICPSQYLSFVLHIICPRSHLHKRTFFVLTSFVIYNSHHYPTQYTSFAIHIIFAYTSLILQIFCPTHHLSDTSFVLHVICHSHHFSYTSFFLHIIFPTDDLS